MRKTALVAGVLTAAVFVVGGTPSASAESAQTKKSNKVITVKSGDYLSKIANAHDTTYQRLFDANTKIKHPDVIYPGDKVRIPNSGEKLKRRSLPAAAPAAQESKPAPKQRTSTPKPAVQSSAPKRAASKPAPKPAGTVSGSVWDRLAHCESTGNWSINTGNGYYGGLQFSLSSWRGVGGSGYPHHASKSEQIARAERLLAIQGWGAWPACSAKLGLR